MKNTLSVSIFSFIGFLLLLVSLPLSLHSQESKIRIIENDAVVRLEPNNTSLVIRYLPLGAELKVIGIIGEWLKVELPPNKDGIVITGYIHQNMVGETGEKKYVLIYLKDKTVLRAKILNQDEEHINVETSLGKLRIERKNVSKIEQIKEEDTLPAEEEKIIQKKETEFLQKPKEAEEQATPISLISDYRKGELGLNLGLGISQFSASSSYMDGGSYYLISSFQEKSDLNASSKNGIFFSGTLSYFPEKSIGLQAIVGYLKSNVTSDVSFDFNWTWNDGRSYSRIENWTGAGEFSVIPISINCILRFGKKVGGYISGGYTLFSNKFNANSFMGMVVMYARYYTQYVDGLKIPVQIDESWNASGMNMGGDCS